MFKATFVVFLSLFSISLKASELATEIASIESAWATAYYQGTEIQQKSQYAILLEKTNLLAKKFPNSAEPKIWQATILATSASLQSSIKALATIKQAKTLLEEAIVINPNALDGAAYVTLGTLYYMMPGWPISFGDNQKAEHYLKLSLAINPNGIDANYFYGDFLIHTNRINEATRYFQKASQVPVRAQQLLADTKLQQEAHMALVQHSSKTNSPKLSSIFTTASYNNQ